MFQILTDASANGDSIILETPLAEGAGSDEESKTYVLVAWGTWDTATVAFYWSPDSGTTWIAITSASFTANGYVSATLPGGAQVKATVSSVGGSTEVSAAVG